MKALNANVLRSLATAGALAVLMACGAAYLMAPPGSTLILVANPPDVAAHGQASELTAFVFEPAGTPVADGTVVFWTSTIGRVDPETRTRNGVARNRFVSDSRSGVAEVCAFTGSGSAPTTPTTTLARSGTGSMHALSASSGATAAVVCPTEGGESVDITVGNERVRAVRLRVEPPRVPLSTGANTTRVIATVFGESGNPVPNVPVYFEVVNPADRFTDHFDSSGEPRFTNNNGEAEDIFRTRRNTAGTSTVRACVPGPGTTAVALICSEPFVIVMH